ncbi:MAG: GGDEF domain-containing protein, partial [Nitrospira sp.]|nr:GGDEF domain-containing protein [Nitrospira sp.]
VWGKRSVPWPEKRAASAHRKVSSVTLKKISITDPLTSLLNRRYFEERISEELERSKRHNQPFSLLIIDIDNFKDFNDTYGHLYGDEVLRNTAHGIRGCTRVIDIAARYGGEEFAVILPTTDKEGALIIGTRIRDEIYNMSFPVQRAEKPAKLTVSIGIATYPDDAATIEDLINNADRALYKAKGLGKNRVVLFGNN